MMWLIPAGMALLGGMQSEKKRKADIIDNQLQAELTKYSPWTKKFGEVHGVSGGFFDGAMKGAMSGLSLAQGIKGLEGKGEGKKDFDTSSYVLDQSTRYEMPELGSEYSPQETGFVGANTPQFNPYSQAEMKTAPVGTLSSDYLSYPNSELYGKKYRRKG